MEGVNEFCDITGADRETATFFLKAAGGDVSEAVSMYYENPMPATPAPAPAPAPSRTPAAAAPPPAPRVTQPPPSAPKPSKPAQDSRFKTLSDLKQENEGKFQNYFTGGEKSGLEVQDPQENDLASQLLMNAQRNAANQRHEDPEETKFSGTGYRLGSSNATPSTPISAQNTKRRVVKKVLTFYKNGFQVDDGPLRSYTEPQNQQFLECCNRGMVPPELEQQNVDLDLQLVDNKFEDFVPPKPTLQVFSGKGYTLGSGSAHTTSQTTPPASQQPHTPAATTATPTPTVTHSDSSRTSLQLRLADGTRLVAQFGLNQTIHDIKKFIVASRPGLNINSFQLMTTFPNKVLTDETATLASAGLQNAVVLQKPL